MAENNSNGVGSFFWGTFLGSIAGVVIALFFAPRSGDALRQELNDSAVTMRKRIEGESIEDALAAGRAEARKLNQTHPMRD